MNISKLVLSLCLAGILFTACGAPSPTGKWEGTVEEENGIRTVSNPETPFFGEIHLELENDLILGEGEDENSIFFQAAAMAVDETGTMFIVDSGNHRIQVFDPEGKFVQSIGKQGQGPGEFDRLGAFFLAGDGTLYARDNNRIQRFKNDGTLLSSIPLTNTIADFWVAPDRHIFGVEIRNSEEGRRRFLVKLDPEGKQLESMAEFSDVKPVDQESGGVRRRFVIQHSYNPTLFLASFSPEIFIYTYSAEYALYCCNSSGKPDLIIKNSDEASSISQQEKDRVRQRLKDRVEEMGMSIPDQILEQGTQFPPTSPF
ncbi:MAG: 6-bladed beta-propeller, partial [Candidatus Aminicenantaceae bacterium]